MLRYASSYNQPKDASIPSTSVALEYSIYYPGEEMGNFPSQGLYHTLLPLYSLTEWEFAPLTTSLWKPQARLGSWVQLHMVSPLIPQIQFPFQ